MFKYCLSLTKRTFKVGDFKETKEKQKKLQQQSVTITAKKAQNNF